MKRLTEIVCSCVGTGLIAGGVCLLILGLVGLETSVIFTASAVAFILGALLGVTGALIHG